MHITIQKVPILKKLKNFIKNMAELKGFKSFVSPSVRCRATDSFRFAPLKSIRIPKICHWHILQHPYKFYFQITVILLYGGAEGIRTLDLVRDRHVS